MKINETIRQRRIERNLTQEQVANYLGVTAPQSINGRRELLIPTSPLYLHWQEF